VVLFVGVLVPSEIELPWKVLLVPFPVSVCARRSGLTCNAGGSLPFPFPFPFLFGSGGVVACGLGGLVEGCVYFTQISSYGDEGMDLFGLCCLAGGASSSPSTAGSGSCEAAGSTIFVPPSPPLARGVTDD